MINRDDVARVAGVSSATVSRVFNRPQTVSADRRKAVLKAAAQLGYIPNKSASSLRRNGTGTITLLEFRKPDRPYYWGDSPNFNWFYADVVRGVNSYVSTTMFSLKMETVKSYEDLQRIASATDGLLCYDADMEEEAEAVKQLDIPYILAHHTGNYRHCNRCYTDNYAGGRLQADFLISRGSVRPLYLTAYLGEVQPHSERLRGFLDRCRENTIEPYVAEIDFTGMEPAKLAAKISAIYSDPACAFDGIGAVNDLMLIRILNSIRHKEGNKTAALTVGDILGRGIHQPQIPMCGYDAVPFRNMLPYTFGSIDINPGRLYYRAAELLVEQVLSGNSELIGEQFLPSVSAAPNTMALRS